MGMLECTKKRFTSCNYDRCAAIELGYNLGPNACKRLLGWLNWRGTVSLTTASRSLAVGRTSGARVEPNLRFAIATNSQRIFVSQHIWNSNKSGENRARILHRTRHIASAMPILD